MRFNIQTKLFVLMAGLTAAILMGVLVSIGRILEDAILKKIVGDFNQTQKVFRKEQGLRYDRLFESAVLIGENTTFKANVQLGNPATVSYIVEEEFALFAKFDLFVVTDREGELLARFNAPENFEVEERPSIRLALSGESDIYEVDDPDSWPELWEVDGDLFQVAIVPVYLRDRIIGTITEGAKITRYEAEQLKGDGAIDITFVLDRKLIGSTIEGLSTEELDVFCQEHRQTIADALQELHPGRPFEGVLAGEEVFAFISPLGRGEAASYVATVPKRFELHLLAELQNNILLVAFISLLITVVLAFLLGRTLSRPILRLVASMNQVKGGNLEVSLPPSTRDEIGLLTSTFNEMIGDLRERLQLMRYVGSHTLEMIRQASGGRVELGGSRRELAVLFSDIRGFTPFSEKRDPEEVISMLNRYLGLQAEVVPEYEGSIDKFVGDEMVALFIGDHALERAIACAVEIQRRTREENEKDQLPIDVGIGINYGPVILGNMGAESRLDYTVIGAEVNLGARLCQTARGGQILIRRELLDDLRVEVEVVETRMMSFKGISVELEIANIAGKE